MERWGNCLICDAPVYEQSLCDRCADSDGSERDCEYCGTENQECDC